MASKKTNRRTVEPSASDYPELTTSNVRLTTEERTRMRRLKIEDVRQHCLDQLELCSFEEAEKMKRLAVLEEELNNELRQTIDFLDQTVSYYDDVMKQYAPPEERTIQAILQEIEGFEFKMELPEGYVRPEEEAEMFKTESASFEEKTARNREEEQELARTIAQLRSDVEKENVYFLAHRQQLEEQRLQYEKRMGTLVKRVDQLQKPSSEKMQMTEILADVTRLREEIEKTSRDIRAVEEKLRDSMRKQSVL